MSANNCHTHHLGVADNPPASHQRVDFSHPIPADMRKEAAASLRVKRGLGDQAFGVCIFIEDENGVGGAPTRERRLLT